MPREAGVLEFSLISSKPSFWTNGSPVAVGRRTLLHGQA